jgi:hypothetical protein
VGVLKLIVLGAVHAWSVRRLLRLRGADVEKENGDGLVDGSAAPALALHIDPREHCCNSARCAFSRVSSSGDEATTVATAAAWVTPNKPTIADHKLITELSLPKLPVRV